MIHYNGLYRVVRKNKSDETTMIYVADSPEGHVVKVGMMKLLAATIQETNLPECMRVPAATPEAQFDLRLTVLQWAEDNCLEFRRDM